MHHFVFRFSGLLIAALLSVNAAQAQSTVRESLIALRGYRFGDDRAAVDALAAQVQAARAQTGQRRAVARQLSVFLTTEATFDAKQFVCRQLVLIATEADVPALTSLLSDPELSGYALFVLQRIPGDSVDAALREALANSNGRIRIGIIHALGDRRDRVAVPELIALSKQDQDTAGAAVGALGRIGDPASIQTLLKSHVAVAPELKRNVAEALLEAGEALRMGGKTEQALEIYRHLEQFNDSPRVQAAALRGRVLSEPGTGAALLLKALGEDGSTRQSMAATVARELETPEATATLARGLDKLPASGQILLLGVLKDRGERAAAGEVRPLCSAGETPVRIAALEALGVLGDASVCEVLLDGAAAGTPGERDVARGSLSQLRGNGVDRALIAMSRQGDAGRRVEAVRALGERGVSSAVESLIQLVRDNEAAVRRAALRVLRDLGGSEHLPALVALMVESDGSRRDELVPVVVAVARQEMDPEKRTGEVIRRLNETPDETIQVTLIGVLGQLGGDAALPILREAARSDHREKRLAGVRALAEWPTAEPGQDLLKIVQDSDDPTLRAIAYRGFVRSLGFSEGQSAEQVTAGYRKAMALAKNDNERRLVLSGLGSAPSLAALEEASKALDNPLLQKEAEVAVVQLGDALAGACPEEVLQAMARLKSTTGSETVREQAAAVEAKIARLGDYVTAWRVSPVYSQAGADCAKLFDIPFAPENPQTRSTVPWQMIPAGTNAEQPWLIDLLAYHGGEQRVAYLLTEFESDQARDVVLEMGSDDGLKVWLNDKLVFANNTQRAVAPNQDKVAVPVLRGSNRLLIKVTQNIMGWGLCLRMTSPEGEPVRGVRPSLSGVIK